MQSETLIIEMTLVAMPLPPEREDAYWEAIRIVAEMIREWIEENPTPSPSPSFDFDEYVSAQDGEGGRMEAVAIIE